MSKLWLPQLPKDWTNARLRWISRIYSGGTPSREKNEYWHQGEIPWLNSGAVNQFYITEPSEHITEAGFAGSSAKWIEPGNLVIALAGQGKTKGMVAKLMFRATGNQSLAAISPASRLNSDYLLWYLTANYDNIRNLSGGEDRDGLNLRLLGDIVCPLPPLPTQVAIANFLDRETTKIDHLIVNLEKLIALLKEKRQAVISHAVTKGLNPNAKMKDSGIDWIGEIPEHWEVVPLKRLGTAFNGLTYSPEDLCGPEQGILVLRSGNVQNDAITLDDNVYVSRTIPERLITREGDILICSRNGSARLIGKNAVISKEIAGATFGAFMAVLRSEFSEFLSWTLRSSLFSSQISMFSTSTINQLTTGTLLNMKIAFPPAGERQTISDSLRQDITSVDESVKLAGSLVELLKEKRSALISAAVTGQVEIAEPAGEVA